MQRIYGVDVEIQLVGGLFGSYNINIRRILGDGDGKSDYYSVDDLGNKIAITAAGLNVQWDRQTRLREADMLNELRDFIMINTQLIN
jgi:hypothetical protein